MGRQEKKNNQSGGLPCLDKYFKNGPRKLVLYGTGAKLYQIPFYSFVRIAKEAKATYNLRKTAVADVGIIEEYLEEHPEVAFRIMTLRKE